MKRIRLNLCILLGVFVTGCDELVEIPPPDTEIVRSTVFENDDTALAAMAGVYNKLVKSPGFSGSFSSITMTAGVYGDELVSYATPGNPIIPYYFNSLSPPNPSMSSMWSSCYNMIYSANSIVEGLSASSGASQKVRQQLMGEALFIRAFIHFYLVNMFGAIPYIKTTDYGINAKVARIPADEVHESIIGDLLKAKEYLVNDYPSANRVRVNKGTVTALLARVYLYNKEWSNAEVQASEIIANTSQYALLTELSEVFLKESKETIWQLIPPHGTTNEGQIFVLKAPPTFVALRNDVVYSFEESDLRRKEWIDSIMSTSGLSKWYFPFKYKDKNSGTRVEYSVVLRLAEQYLVRAEARAEQNRLIGSSSAESDINIIRTRAGLSGSTVLTKDQLLAMIERERRVELFTEWGHRFFDLKRWGKLDAILDPIKPNWDSTDALLPLPQSELLANPKLTQNPGY